MEGNLLRTIATQHEYVAHYHTAGNPGRHEINRRQEINYEAVIRAIGATGYTGYVAQEFLPQGDPVAALREAYTICDVTR